jgi:hypothetical protein
MYFFVALLVLAAGIILGVRWMQQPFSPHSYGIKPVVLADGQKIYLKREAGLHYDRTALSLNGDRCIGPNDATDYVLSTLGAGESPLYYLLGKNEVTVYDSKLSAPTRLNWTLTIKQETLLNEPHFGGREEDYESRGISKVEVSLRELYACKR